MSTVTTFDPIKFKTTTRAQWENAAEAWHRWGPLLGEWLGPVTERMLDLSRVEAGSRVLDVAAGAGEQTLRAAQRVGPSGHVLATDISPAILEYAAATAREAGLSQVATRELDGEVLDELPAGTFDAVISRVGLIYFPDQQKALAGMKHVLKPGGRIGAIVYSTPEKNAFFSIPVSIIRRRAKLPPPLPGQPGPFSLGADGVLAAVLWNSCLCCQMKFVSPGEQRLMEEIIVTDENIYTGTCFCNAVELTVTGEPVAMGYCHCESCRAWSAGPVNGFTLWKPDALKITQGAEHIGEFQKTERSIRKWCKRCGGHLLTEHPTWGVIDVYAAIIPKLAFKPSVHVNYQETVLPIRDGLPKQRDIPAEMGGSGVLLPE